MKQLSTILLLSILFAPSIMAQEIIDNPICFTVINKAPYGVYGDVSTNYYTAPDGSKARHVGTFSLKKAGETHKEKGYPTDRSEFCSSGPFYQDRKLEITLKTMFPIFSCKTNIELGEIIIHGTRKEDGTTKTWITCY